MRRMDFVVVALVIGFMSVGCRQSEREQTKNTNTVAQNIPTNGVYPVIQVIVPDDFATISEAVRRAPALSKTPGDVQIGVRPGRYNVASGEVFPIEVTKNLSVSALGANVMLEYELTQPISAMVHIQDETSVSGFTIVSSSLAIGSGAFYAIQAFGVRNIFISGNTMLTRNGVNVSGGGGTHIQYNVFAPPNRSAFGRSGGDIAIEVPSSEYLGIRNNTIIGMSWGVIVANAVYFDFSENIIVYASAAAVKLDNASLSSLVQTDRNYRNDLWMNNDDFYNSSTLQSITVTPSRYGANISADPIFVDWENDFRIHSASPAAHVAIPQPKPLGIPDFVRIGAKSEVSYRTAMTLALDFNSPRGPVSIVGPNTEVLRFRVTAASTADVELKVGHLIEFEMFTIDPNQPSRPMPQILIAETPLRQTLSYHQASFSTGNMIRLGVGVTQPTTIDAGKTKIFSIYIDSTGFQTGDTIQFVLKRLDWSDGVLPRISDGRTQRIDGYPLSF